VARRVSSPVFVGRDEELTALGAALERAAGGRAQSVLLAGDSAVGKTRLLHEFRRGAEASGTRWLWGECVALAEGELPYAPMTAALRTIVGELEALDMTAESAPELARLLPKLGPVPAPNPLPSADEIPPPSVGGELAQARLFEQFLSLLADLSSERPVVLAVEDLHWADRSTRDLLSFLIRNAHAEALLLVCTYRSDELHRRHPLRPFLAEHGRLGSVELLELRPFTQPELCVPWSTQTERAWPKHGLDSSFGSPVTPTARSMSSARLSTGCPPNLPAWSELEC
jgi:predicted ATPase